MYPFGKRIRLYCVFCVSIQGPCIKIRNLLRTICLHLSGQQFSDQSISFRNESIFLFRITYKSAQIFTRFWWTEGLPLTRSRTWRLQNPCCKSTALKLCIDAHDKLDDRNVSRLSGKTGIFLLSILVSTASAGAGKNKSVVWDCWMLLTYQQYSLNRSGNDDRFGDRTGLRKEMDSKLCVFSFSWYNYFFFHHHDLSCSRCFNVYA